MGNRSRNVTERLSLDKFDVDIHLRQLEGAGTANVTLSFTGNYPRQPHFVEMELDEFVELSDFVSTFVKRHSS